MKAFVIAGAGIAANILLAVGATVAIPTALGAPPDYTNLPVNPNDVTDSTAYVAGKPILNPDGQPGVEVVYTHRDSTRKITDTISVLPDALAASAMLAGNNPEVVTNIPGGGTQPAPVGVNGKIITGASPDGTRSVTVVMFNQGRTATAVEFSGAAGDPVPSDLAVDYAQKQDAAIKAAGLV
jgi:hypothetical protein